MSKGWTARVETQPAVKPAVDSIREGARVGEGRLGVLSRGG